MSDLSVAIICATDAHNGQKDKAGKLYILHPLRVMLQMKTETEQIIAVMHDMIEDTAYTCADLEQEKFSKKIIEAVICLTRKKQESYDLYINRIKSNKLAKKIKIADLKDNMNLARLKTITIYDHRRQKKYYKALKELIQ